MDKEWFQLQANMIIERRLEQLQQLSYSDALALPEVDGRDCMIGKLAASVTIFRQASPYGLSGMVLVVALVARPNWLGMFERHFEKGLVFSPDGTIREATETELQNSGG